MNLFQLLPLLLVLLLSSTAELGGSSTEVMDHPSSRIRCLEIEREALLKFKDELVDTNGRLSSWGDQENQYECCKWIGIHCHNKTNHVTRLDLSTNNLEGEIPSSITTLVGLVGLNISRNNLTGFIPKNIGQLPLLDSLDLSRNHLRGDIPTSLSELNQLGTLNLSYNNLSGRIPRSGHALTFDRSSYIGNNDLCGEPLNKSCPGDEAHHGIPMYKQEQDDDDDDDDELITEGFYISIGLGFIVGFWGIFGAILLNKELRYAFFGVLNSFGDFVYGRVELTKAHLRRHSPNQ